MANTLVRPMKPFSKTPSLDLLTYPLFASDKIDGVRCYIRDGVALSNANKPLPNKHLQAWVQRNQVVLEGFDGEVIKKGNRTDFNVNQSLVMSTDGDADFELLVFDSINNPFIPYDIRLATLKSTFDFCMVPSKAALLPQTMIGSKEELQAYWDNCVERGLEGAIARAIDAPYKYGRSTLKEQYVIKLKVWYDAEATIIDVKEKMHNGNVAAASELGLMKRSSHKANKTGMNTLGALVTDKFACGTGFSKKLAKELWKLHQAGELVGKSFTYKFVKEDDGIPRHPVFKGLRSDHL